jgi:LmbE family N-acetylglucosaminyl deacetylase
VASFVFLHAHPDDEAIATSGLIAAATEAGHQVTVIFATAGERGEMPDDLGGHSSLGDLRAAEARAAGDLLNARVEFLGYSDSGMDPERFTDGSFAAADVEEAAQRLLDLLKSLSADVLIGYDEFGITGHPDHRQVHTVARRAAELAADAGLTLWRYEGTLSRKQLDLFQDLTVRQTPSGEETPQFTLRSGETAGIPMVAVDVSAWIDTKRAAMAAHASQIGDTSFFLRIPPEDFTALWGTEYYLAPSGIGPLTQFAAGPGGGA